jgi:hypothetical protein
MALVESNYLLNDLLKLSDVWILSSWSKPTAVLWRVHMSTAIAMKYLIDAKQALLVGMVWLILHEIIVLKKSIR